MEGMAAGTPIIAREGEGGAELVEEYGTGFLYKPDEGISAVAEHIVDLRSDHRRYQTVSEVGRCAAVNDFSLRNFALQLVKAYSNLLSG